MTCDPGRSAKGPLLATSGVSGTPMVSCAKGPGKMISRCLVMRGDCLGVFVIITRPSHGPNSSAFPTQVHPCGGSVARGPCCGGTA